ncbi:NHLP bacteriocin system secretion protein [Salidesulfovibrio brasiliensis]|uniref:NHLP bacteriocin system secretion protein n=1 Tax=Salidesulfovibrio brasiliensis TaxID=221711 RepID=UPI0006CF42FA|nr:NHLP bacteriocin system secretion protein [Salidesulfovibrio brasiliensis]
MSQIFRKVALDRLSSPEQLDQVMRVTSPMGWAVLAACMLLVGMGVVWGFFGTIPTKVSGQGILVEKGALFDVVSLSDGQIVEVFAGVDETVEQDQVVARINQPELQHQLEEAQRTLDHLLEERAFVNQLGSDIHASRTRHIAQQRKTLTDSIRLAETRLDDLHERVVQHEKLVGQGIVARKTYLDVKAEYNQVLQEVLKYREQLASLPTTTFEAASERRKEQIDVERRIIHAEEEVDSLKDKLELAESIVTPKKGRVNEVFKAPGAFLRTGEALLNLETYSPDDSFYISAYFSPDQGKRIKPGMTMHVAPSVTKREEYGVVIGEVVSVSAFPASTRGMMHLLENEKLVEMLSREGPPIKVRAKLVKDPQSHSGFKWSSGKGAPVKLQSGTMCQADVVVEEQRPISLLIPYLKKTVLGIGE